MVNLNVILKFKCQEIEAFRFAFWHPHVFVWPQTAPQVMLWFETVLNDPCYYQEAVGWRRLINEASYGPQGVWRFKLPHPEKETQLDRSAQVQSLYTLLR